MNALMGRSNQLAGVDMLISFCTATLLFSEKSFSKLHCRFNAKPSEFNRALAW
jgi:hypothetical protein